MKFGDVARLGGISGLTPKAARVAIPRDPDTAQPSRRLAPSVRYPARQTLIPEGDVHVRPT